MLEARLIEDELAVGLIAPIEEQPLGEAAAHDGLEELLGDDLIGIDVGTVEGGDQAGEILEWFDHWESPKVGRSVGGPIADVDEVAGDGGGCGHDRADQVGPAALALAP